MARAYQKKIYIDNIKSINQSNHKVLKVLYVTITQSISNRCCSSQESVCLRPVAVEHEDFLGGVQSTRRANQKTGGKGNPKGERSGCGRRRRRMPVFPLCVYSTYFTHILPIYSFPVAQQRTRTVYCCIIVPHFY